MIINIDTFTDEEKKDVVITAYEIVKILEKEKGECFSFAECNRRMANVIKLNTILSLKQELKRLKSRG